MADSLKLVARNSDSQPCAGAAVVVVGLTVVVGASVVVVGGSVVVVVGVGTVVGAAVVVVEVVVDGATVDDVVDEVEVLGCVVVAVVVDVVEVLDGTTSVVVVGSGAQPPAGAWSTVPGWSPSAYQGFAALSAS
jgi:hypothetical protein